MIPASYAPREPPPDSTKPIFGVASDGRRLAPGTIVNATGSRASLSKRHEARARRDPRRLGVAGPGAEATLDEYGDRRAAAARRSSWSRRRAISTSSCAARSPIVELRQRIANPGAGALAASLRARAAARAPTVIGFSLRDPSGAAAQAAVPVDAHAPTIRGATPGARAWTPRSRRASAGGGYARDPAADRGGSRGARDHALRRARRAARRRAAARAARARRAGQARRVQGTVRATPGPGATVRKIRVGGAETPGGRAAPFVARRAGRRRSTSISSSRASSRSCGRRPSRSPTAGARSLVTVLGPQR